MLFMVPVINYCIIEGILGCHDWFQTASRLVYNFLSLTDVNQWIDNECSKCMIFNLNISN